VCNALGFMESLGLCDCLCSGARNQHRVCLPLLTHLSIYQDLLQNRINTHLRARAHTHTHTHTHVHTHTSERNGEMETETGLGIGLFQPGVS
jgi:hypothetical protein